MGEQTDVESSQSAAACQADVRVDVAGGQLCLGVPEAELTARRARLESNGGYKPKARRRPVSPALRAYAAMATSADKGAVRDVSKLEI